jgi:hypothetical protein
MLYLYFLSVVAVILGLLFIYRKFHEESTYLKTSPEGDIKEKHEKVEGLYNRFQDNILKEAEKVSSKAKKDLASTEEIKNKITYKQ